MYASALAVATFGGFVVHQIAGQTSIPDVVDTVLSTSVSDVTVSEQGGTVRLFVTLGPGEENLYSIFGSTSAGEDVMTLPHAFNNDVGTDFGVPALTGVAEIDSLNSVDSYLTIGEDTPTDDMSVVGSLGFTSWLSHGISADNAALVCTDPDNCPGGTLLVAQITVPFAFCGEQTATMNFAGKVADQVETGPAGQWRSTATFNWEAPCSLCSHPADVDSNHVVDVEDLLFVLSVYGESVDAPGGWETNFFVTLGGCAQPGDTDDNGIINVDDLMYILSFFGEEV